FSSIELRNKATSTFKDILSTAATKIVALAKSAKSEADVVYAFDTVYLELLKNVLGLEFKPSKEESIDTVKMTANGRKSKKGRIDSRIGSVVIEFKHPSKLKSKAALLRNSDEKPNLLKLSDCYTIY
ncbi:hypothetical protein, partial [Vibrio parahaemolyticus]|uniref:hypothetical protein n=1 Tax=Vibrio parahaemolyticus TaxID=670 RepID=UPI001E455442